MAANDNLAFAAIANSRVQNEPVSLLGTHFGAQLKVIVDTSLSKIHRLAAIVEPPWRQRLFPTSNEEQVRAARSCIFRIGRRSSKGGMGEVYPMRNVISSRVEAMKICFLIGLMGLFSRNRSGQPPPVVFPLVPAQKYSWLHSM